MFTGPNEKGLPCAYPLHEEECGPTNSCRASEGMLESLRCRVHQAWSWDTFSVELQFQHIRYIKLEQVVRDYRFKESYDLSWKVRYQKFSCH